ncbi:hypothetical protein F5887DRAFT_1173525 [Amanita rubescens]|nr:hypothetical protein F5887DRAFT_1173525 [Amanita rubescens]
MLSSREFKTRENKLHVLVNNSGITWGGPSDDFPEEKGWDNVFIIQVLTSDTYFQIRRKRPPHGHSTRPASALLASPSLFSPLRVTLNQNKDVNNNDIPMIIDPQSGCTCSFNICCNSDEPHPGQSSKDGKSSLSRVSTPLAYKRLLA